MHRLRHNFFLACIGFVVLIIFKVPVALAAPTLTNIVDNRADFGGSIPAYEKLEITFDAGTTAANPYYPYDSAPPPGVDGNAGISVNMLVTRDSWQNTITQPAFYYQDFDYSVKDGKDWIYPTGSFRWKARFTPAQPGNWQYKITAQDATGTHESQPVSFTVTASQHKGFIKVSPLDSRYFMFDDGTYFPGLSLNGKLDRINPVSGNQANIASWGQNGIQLFRAWLSTWTIFGAAWSPWASLNPAHGTEMPNARLRHDRVAPFNQVPGVPPLARSDSDVFLWLNNDTTAASDGTQWNFTPCMVLGWQTAQVPIKQNTAYRLRVRYRERNLAGPKTAGQPFGFTVKTGSWLWHNTNEQARCYSPGTGTLLAASYSMTPQWTHFADPLYPDWTILEGTFSNTTSNFLERMWLSIENAVSGDVLVDYVWIEEVIGNGQYGPNVVYKPWMASHKYIDQRQSYGFDRLLDVTKANNLYLKLVIMEKQDYLFNIFEFDGSLSPYQPSDNPTNLFFGNGRELQGPTKVRWLQKVWWRYLQARWGYSPNIHSWELLNEGDPANTNHHILADELGKFMHQFYNKHLVTTSFWSGFNNAFWSNPLYPDVDYGDIHQYPDQAHISLPNVYTQSDFNDEALISQKLSMFLGSLQPNGPRKPVMRGEVGFTFSATDPFTANTTGGAWLHNFIWAGINSGGVMESYWTGPPTQDHITKTNSHDYRTLYRPYFNFIQTIPLASGGYIDAGAQSSDLFIRAWGQKKTDKSAAHLWIQNATHTWKNIVDQAVLAKSGTITIPGLSPSTSYTLEWWDTYAGSITNSETRTTDGAGSLSFPVSFGTSINSSPKPDIAVSVRIDDILGDMDHDGDVDITDFRTFIPLFGTTSTAADFNADGTVDLFDANILISHFGL